MTETPVANPNSKNILSGKEQEGKMQLIVASAVEGSNISAEDLRKLNLQLEADYMVRSASLKMLSEYCGDESNIPDDQSLLAFKNKVQTLIGFVQGVSGLVGASDPSVIQVKTIEYEESRKAFVDIFGGLPDSLEKINIDVSNGEDISICANVCAQSRHDYRTPLTSIIGFLDMGTREKYGGRKFLEEGNRTVWRSFIVENMRHIAPIIESTNLQLTNEYERRDFNQEELSSFVDIILSQNSDLVGNTSMLSNTKSFAVSCSSSWLGRLVQNVSQNESKAFKVQREQSAGYVPYMRVVFEDVQPGDGQGRFVDMVFEDNGPGFPEAVLKDGFTTGQTEWGGRTDMGTGVGMAGISKVLDEQYGIKVIPENIVDTSGKIQGARLRVRMNVS